ncbi:hypothetical protein Bca4012_062808 [Brassica carinata]
MKGVRTTEALTGNEPIQLTVQSRERSTFRRSESSRNERAEDVVQPKASEHIEKDAILEVRSDISSQKMEEKKELVPVDDSLDLANEVVEAMNITEGDVGMEVDEKVAPDDEESGVIGAVNSDSGVTGDITGEEESKEEGEVEKGAGEGGVVKKNGAKKKSSKAGIIGAGGTTKKRLVQNMIAQGKRTVAKTSSFQEEGSKKMEEKGFLNPKPSSTK